MHKNSKKKQGLNNRLNNRSVKGDWMIDWTDSPNEGLYRKNDKN